MEASTRPSPLAFDDSGGSGRLVVLLPGAGDLRSEYRFLTGGLTGAGHRVVTADLPGHGDSPPAVRYTVEATAEALLRLIEEVGGGPAVVVGTSFAPAAAVWAAAERPDLVDGVVAISPHLHADRSVQGRLQRMAISTLLRGPWAAGLWARLYRSWYRASPPPDLDEEVRRLRVMLADPSRRRAVRETLVADRDGLDDRIARFDRPSLTVFGTADGHFADPAGEAVAVASALGGDHLLVEGAGHYPHVEQPERVGTSMLALIGRLD